MTKIMKGGIAYNSTANMVALTQAEYNALTTAQKNNGNFYFITDSDPSYFSAENIDYDNTSSGLSATNIQGAVDEVVTDITDNYRVKSRHLAAAKTYRVVVTNQWQTVIIIGLINGSKSFYTFLANSANVPNDYQIVYGTNQFTATQINNTTFDLTVGASSDVYIMCDYVSIT